jgi:hypothetical protein
MFSKFATNHILPTPQFTHFDGFFLYEFLHLALAWFTDPNNPDVKGCIALQRRRHGPDAGGPSISSSAAAPPSLAGPASQIPDFEDMYDRASIRKHAVSLGVVPAKEGVPSGSQRGAGEAPPAAGGAWAGGGGGKQKKTKQLLFKVGLGGSI